VALAGGWQAGREASAEAGGSPDQEKLISLCVLSVSNERSECAVNKMLRVGISFPNARTGITNILVLVSGDFGVKWLKIQDKLFIWCDWHYFCV